MVKMRTSENVAAVSKALVAAIGAMDGVRKDAQNSAFKANGKVSTYATLAACIEASRAVLSENKLCVIQGPGATNTDAKTLTITTRIIHESGEWIETDFDMPLTKWSPHEAGSATTYGRRFALMAMLGLAPVEDDDGNAAAGVKAEKMLGDAAEPVTKEQAEAIAALLAETKSDVPLFLKYFKVESVEALPSSQYGAAIQALRAKQKSREAS
jgi:hypothetical protein